MKSLLLTFDLEEFVCPAERKLGIPKERLFEVSREGLKNIIKILIDNNIRATFFTTYEFANKNKDLIKLLSKHKLIDPEVNRIDADIFAKHISIFFIRPAINKPNQQGL